MKVIVTLSLISTLIAAAMSSELSLLFDSKEKLGDKAEIVSEDRLKDQEALKKAKEESDKLAFRKGTGDELSVDKSEEYEYVYKFEDFADEKGKNYLSKHDNFGLKLVDDSNVDKSDEFASSKGTHVGSAVKSKFDKSFDSEVFDEDELLAESDSASKLAHATDFESENLLGDRSESLFARGLQFEFADFRNNHHNEHHEPSIGRVTGLVDDVIPSEVELIEDGRPLERGVVSDIGSPVTGLVGGVDLPRTGLAGDVDPPVTDLVGDVIPSGAGLIDDNLIGDIIPSEVRETADIPEPDTMLRGRLASVFKNRRYRG